MQKLNGLILQLLAGVSKYCRAEGKINCESGRIWPFVIFIWRCTDFSRMLLLIPGVSFTSEFSLHCSQRLENDHRDSWAQFNPDLASNSSFPQRLANRGNQKSPNDTYGQQLELIFMWQSGNRAPAPSFKRGQLWLCIQHFPSCVSRHELIKMQLPKPPSSPSNSPGSNASISISRWKMMNAQAPWRKHKLQSVLSWQSENKGEVFHNMLKTLGKTCYKNVNTSDLQNSLLQAAHLLCSVSMLLFSFPGCTANQL